MWLWAVCLSVASIDMPIWLWRVTGAIQHTVTEHDNNVSCEIVSQLCIGTYCYIIIIRSCLVLYLFYLIHQIFFFTFLCVTGCVSHYAIQFGQIIQCLFYHRSVSSENHSYWTIIIVDPCKQTMCWLSAGLSLCACVRVRMRASLFLFVFFFNWRMCVQLLLRTFLGPNSFHFRSAKHTGIYLPLDCRLLTSIKFSKSIQNCCHWALHQRMTRSFW